MINVKIVDTGPKILTWDVETSYMLLRGYEMFPKHGYPVSAIERDWHMLGAAWKWLHKPTGKVVSVNHKNPLNDYEVIGAIHAVLSEADILVGHNADGFDLKKFNTRAIKWGFPPIAPKKSVDTLKVARRHFKFTSNQLRYIADFLGVEGKSESPDWAKCIAGDEEALRYMRRYNLQDVIATEQVYLKLRGYHHNHPDLNAFRPIADVQDEPVHVCPSCQSPDLRTDQARFSKKGKLVGHLYQCNSCNRWSQR